MRIVIIDNQNKRANALSEWIASLKTDQGEQKYHVTPYKSVAEEQAVNQGNINDILIFLHVGERQGNMRAKLINRYSANHVVCYSGGTTVAEEYEEHQRQFPLHYWYQHMIPEDGIVDHVKINFQKFLDAYPSTPEILSALLQNFDPVLEAKLDLLYWIFIRKLSSFKITNQILENLKERGVSSEILKKLERLKDQKITDEKNDTVDMQEGTGDNWKILIQDDNKQGKRKLFAHIEKTFPNPDCDVPVLSEFIELRRYLFDE